MSHDDKRQMSSILRSIETLENQANVICNDYTTANNDIDRVHAILVDDTNTHLQIFFQHLERLLQIDLRNRSSLLNNKRTYWNFFLHALKESKGLYDTVLYVLNSHEVKTSIGRGRLFIRFCLQNHRLGDVIQQSFMTKKVVSQFYHDECFWTKPMHMNRIVQALYQLNDVHFDLLTNSQYQLDVCWPTSESVDSRLKNSYDPVSRFRTNSISSYVSMDSLSSQSMISSSFPIAMSPAQHLATSMIDSHSPFSASSIDEDAENTLDYWKERCEELERQRQSVREHPSTSDAHVQCSVEACNQTTQASDEHEEPVPNPISALQSQNDLLKEDINNLNFQLSTLTIQRTNAETKFKDHEREVAKHQALMETKEKLLKDMQRKLDEQQSHIKAMQEQHVGQVKKQEKRIDQLTQELQKTNQLLEEERQLIEKERGEHSQIQDQLEASIQEKTLDFEEMKRRLIKAVREKADLFNSIYTYEVKLEEEQAKQCVHEDDVLKCSKCETTFGWTMRKYRCRHCQKIFCYYCSNHLQPGATPNSQLRLCDHCNEKFVRESLMSNYTMLDDPEKENETKTDDDLKFEVRSERLNATPDTSAISEHASS